MFLNEKLNNKLLYMQFQCNATVDKCKRYSLKDDFQFLELSFESYLLS